MAPLCFSANVSWLFPELPRLAERLQAAGRAGFEAAEVAWPYAEPPQALASATRAAGLRLENLVGLLEPINTRITDPQYFLDTPQQAAAILQKVGRPNLQLQMDIFHWQIMDGNLTGNIREFLPIVGHVQVAQVPDRGEPGSSGELDFSYLFQLLEDEGYQGFVGCEYRPQGDTVEGLSWLRSYWDRKGHPRTGQ
ncbi:hypothetical protein STEG23_000968 [Scotinomys teguina]